MTDGPELMFLFIVLLGSAMLIAAIISLRRAKNTEFWRYTSGKILRSEIETIQRNTINNRNEIVYAPKIIYSYEVDEKEYVSNRIKIMNDYSSNSPKAVQKIISKYRRDSDVVIYYNPRKPEKSVLEKGISKNIYILLIFSFVILIGSLLFANQFGIISIQF